MVPGRETHSKKIICHSEFLQKKKAVQTNDKVSHDFDRRLQKNLKGKWRYRTNKRTNQRKKIFFALFF